MKGRVFSGLRPTGKEHIGHYLGVLRNWVALQQDYQCIYCAVDVHALTTLDKDRVGEIRANVRDMMLDWLALGLDPEKSILFVQSHVPEVMTLHTLLSMITPLGWLMRVPTFKEQVRQLKETEDTVNFGLLGYPVLMTADIILYKADTVPVGEDQLPHLELAREIVRRFHNIFGGPVFPEPQPTLSEAPLILGLDGKQKMSKSLDNHIELAASPEETRKRVLTAYTDPQKVRLRDPGRPEVCNVFSMHKHFGSQQIVPTKLDKFQSWVAVTEIAERCRGGKIGCVECKGILADRINAQLAPFREKRRELEARPGLVEEVLAEGASRARAIARQTLEEVEAKMGLR